MQNNISINLGDFQENTTVYLPWSTKTPMRVFGGTCLPSKPISPTDYGTIKIYKDNNTTEMTTEGVAAAVTLDQEFDGRTGEHMITIDISDDTDTGFFAAGHDYSVYVEGATIDAITGVGMLLGVFSIENRNNELALRTTIADDDPDGSSIDQTFTLAAGSTNDDEYNNMVVSVKDISGGVIASRRVTDYDGSTKKITCDYPFEFPLAIGDVVKIYADTYSQTAGAAAVSEIADAVWDESEADHKTKGTMGFKQVRSDRTGRLS